MHESAVFIILSTLLLLAAVILREPKLLIPAVILGLPFEYLETREVASFGSTGIMGAVRSLMNPGQAAMAATVVVAIVRKRHNLSGILPDSSLVVPFAGLFALLFLGVAWSDSLRPANSVLILPLYLGFILTAPSLIEDRRDLERIIGAFLLAAFLLASLAAAQRVFHVFNWRGVLIQSDDYSYRSNATFADPNILARFLAISMALAAGLILATGPRRTTVYLAIPAFAAGCVGIVATASRSGWMVLLFVGFLVVMSSPIARATKAKLTLVALSGLGGMLVLLFLQGGTDAERVKSLAMGVQVIGQREFLIRAGWQMWKDNPLIGVGSGNYQHALVVSYLYLIPDWARTTLSHTSLVSILAELGLVGLSMFAFVALRVGITVFSTYFRTPDPFNRLMTGWLGASMLGLVLHSQSEGRLLDEPYLWVLVAIFMAVETGRNFARPLPAPAPGLPAEAEANPEAAKGTIVRRKRPAPAPAGSPGS